jgi:cobalamin biosynthesis protein CobW
MNDLTKLPVTVVTGFLGSGKTTLIRHLMQNPGGKRLAIIVNEFGDVGVDGEILKSCAIPNCPEENILELANGCICCTVADDFIPTLERLMKLEPRPEHILIETSGLALPKPLLKAFDWPDIRSKIMEELSFLLNESSPWKWIIQS